MSTSTTDLDNTMLLDIVACTRKISKTFRKEKTSTGTESTVSYSQHQSNPIQLQVNLTFSRNISSNNLPRTQPHSCNLPLARVRLLRLGDTSLKTNTLQTRRTLQRRRSTATSPLSGTNTAADLVVRSADDRRAGKLPLWHGGEAGSGCAEYGVEIEAGGNGGLFRGEGDSG